jgi:membrane dipeptidase
MVLSSSRICWPVIAGAALCLIAAPGAARTPDKVAEAALRAAPVWDGHNDVPMQVRARHRNMLEAFDFRDTTRSMDAAGAQKPMHTDLARLRRGRVGAQFWSVYVPATLPEPQAVQATLEQIDVLKRLVARYPRDLQLATSAADVDRAMKAGRIASLIGIEGGHSIGGSLGVLRQMHALGVRYMTLVHFRSIGWVDSATDAPMHQGLNDFGRQVVREMQRIGMLVDLSHVSEAAMMDALDAARAPVMFSHSGARAVNGHPRNVSDAVLDRVKANGGIVMVVTLPAYVSENVREWSALREGEKARAAAFHPDDPEGARRALDAWEKANPQPGSTMPELADHFEYIIRRIGIDHVGIGADFDGMATTTAGMEDVSGYPALFGELASRGYSQADLEKISSRNMVRVLRASEAYAAAHRGDPPIESPTTF